MYLHGTQPVQSCHEHWHIFSDCAHPMSYLCKRQHLYANIHMEALLDAHQLTTMLGVSRRTLETIIEKQEGPAFIMIGRQRRWRPSDVEEWYESRLVQRTSGVNAVETIARGAGTNI